MSSPRCHESQDCCCDYEDLCVNVLEISSEQVPEETTILLTSVETSTPMDSLLTTIVDDAMELSTDSPLTTIEDDEPVITTVTEASTETTTASEVTSSMEATTVVTEEVITQVVTMEDESEDVTPPPPAATTTEIVESTSTAIESEKCISSASCHGRCGGGSDEDCWCDDICVHFDDCCCDRKSLCYPMVLYYFMFRFITFYCSRRRK